MKLDPLEDDEIKILVRQAHRTTPLGSYEARRLLLTLAHERARAVKLQAWMNWLSDRQGPSPSVMEDWLAAELDAIGWPKEDRT